MRRHWLILVGIAVLGCKDKPAEKPAEPASPAAKPAAPSTPEPGTSATNAPGAAAINAPAPPALAQEFDAESEDAAWADSQEKTIRAVAPDVSDVVCRQQQCRVTLGAATMEELVARTEKLQREDSLRSTEAKSILLSAPETIDGKPSIKIYVRYDR